MSENNSSEKRVVPKVSGTNIYLDNYKNSIDSVQGQKKKSSDEFGEIFHSELDKLQNK